MKNPALLAIEKQGTIIPFFNALTIIVVSSGSFWLIPPAFPEVIPESDIETLEVFEVIGTKVTNTPRTIVFHLPQLKSQDNNAKHLRLPDLNINTKTLPTRPPLLLDQTGEVREQFTRVKPFKLVRPLYPRIAREQGLQGKVVLRALVSVEGVVENVTIQESSGFPVLDESATQALRLWLFEPAKNGEFPVSSVIDLPIRFDLRQ